MLVAVIADTHLRGGLQRLPADCIAVIEGSDAVIHAGDVMTAAALDELRAIGPPVHAVHGNVDEPQLQRLLPAALWLDLDGHAVTVVHDAGARRGRLGRLRRRYPDAEAVIFGHSHMPAHEGVDDFQIFNPGSPTQRRRAPRRSMGRMRIDAEGIGFELIDL